jgi:hypothetical protein
VALSASRDLNLISAENTSLLEGKNESKGGTVGVGIGVGSGGWGISVSASVNKGWHWLRVAQHYYRVVLRQCGDWVQVRMQVSVIWRMVQ